jgi:hypothetical protein
MLKLIVKIFSVLLFAFLLSVGIDYLYKNYYKLEFQLLPKNLMPFGQIAEKYDVVGLGNSHSESGFAFEKYNVKSLLLVGVAQSLKYDFAMLRMHSQQIKKGAVILINVSPISFSQKIPGREENLNMNYYDGRLSPLLIPNLKVPEYLQIQVFPSVRATYLWREQISKDQAQKAMATFAAQWKNTATPSATEVPPTPDLSAREINHELNLPSEIPTDRLMESVRFMVNKWENTGGFDIQSFAENRKDLEDIIIYSLKNNWRPVLVSIPISKALQDNLSPGFLKKNVYDNLEKADLKGVKYFDFSKDLRITEKAHLYSNSDHLNRKGAVIFSYLLLQKLINMEYLPKSADGYRTF